VAGGDRPTGRFSWGRPRSSACYLSVTNIPGCATHRSRCPLPVDHGLLLLELSLELHLVDELPDDIDVAAGGQALRDKVRLAIDA
jgi:hypothetical protein